MNAPLSSALAANPGPDPGHGNRAARQAQVVAALSAVLPAHALLFHSEDTVPYECDGLTAYRATPLVVALPETAAFRFPIFHLSFQSPALYRFYWPIRIIYFFD